MANHGEVVSFIWGVADLIRDSFKRGHYQDVILPFTVLRRIDAVLAPTKQKVIDTYLKLKGKLENLDPQLCKASGFAFYNTSKYDFEKLLAEPQQLAANLRRYINGFSKNMRDVIEKFDFENTISRLETANLLFKVVEKFADTSKVDLSPAAISNHEMGYVFEELIRKFNEVLDENPGEHFTPREVIRLMVNLMFSHDRAALKRGKVIRTVYDPCCGSGGMLTIAKERIQQINPAADVHLFGQEVNPSTYAVSKSDLYIKSADGRDAENIAFGSTLSHDGHADRTFDYLLTNPPYGKDWNLDQEAVRAEGRQGDQEPVCRRAAADQRRPTSLPPAHARPHASPDRRNQPRQHHHERLAALYRRRRFGRKRNPPLDPRKRLPGSTGRTAAATLLQYGHQHLRLGSEQQQARRPQGQSPVDRRLRSMALAAEEPGTIAPRHPRRRRPRGDYIPHIVKLFEAFSDDTLTIPAAEPKELRARSFRPPPSAIARSPLSGHCG